MHIDIITCAPEPLTHLFNYGIIRRALEKGVATLGIHNLRHYGVGKHNKIDDTPYGGEPGMVLRLEPIVACMEELQETRTYDALLYLAPEGRLWTQSLANGFSLYHNLLLLCGHYKGIDERICQLFPFQKISIGPYVLPGGELPAAILAQSMIRLLPGAISDGTSALQDTFQDGLVAPPVFTRPPTFRGLEVPGVLLSGHKAKIEAWKSEQSEKRTLERMDTGA